MGWFEEQIKQRIESDDEIFQNVFTSMTESIIGKTFHQIFLDDQQKAQTAVEEILKYYKVTSVYPPEDLTDFELRLEYQLHPSGVMHRVVHLEDAWYKDAVGAFLAKRKDGSFVALLPCKSYGYSFFDYDSGKTMRLNRQTMSLLETEAICFYKPFPVEKLGMRNLFLFIAQTRAFIDYAMLIIATLAITLIGLLIPKLNKLLFSNVIEIGSTQLFLSVGIMLLSVVISTTMFHTISDIVMERLQTKTNIAVEAATMMRTLSLPTSFFKEYNSGEISSRIQHMQNLCSMLSSSLLSISLTAIFSLIYTVQMFYYGKALWVPAMTLLLIHLGFSVLTISMQIKYARKTMTLSAKETGLIYSLIAAVQKLKLSGSEKRAFAKWGTLYSQKAKVLYNPPTFLKISGIIPTGISMFGTIILYYIAIQSHIPTSDYLAFQASYGMLTGAFLSISSIAFTFAQIKPTLEMVKPLLETVPDVVANKKVLTQISGSIELSNISFRYSENTPFIFEHLSLKINPKQYIAIVGKTGCGKSTLLRLLLGFETPTKGSIYYDRRDLTSIDLKSLRKQIGVVMQNSKLFAGDIFSNITISAPWLTLDDAWEAAELAGIAQDIRDMPMGMHTLISEGSGGISGGQKQRLMIARVIASKPRILIFDEATSALDNITQKHVTESLSKLNCTRIVIAHRLSTIKQCNRIIVLDKGHIIEDGSYEELLHQKGYFANLVERQQV